MPPTYGNGKICYLEMPARDIDRSSQFYSSVFGWKTRRRGDGSLAFDDSTGEVSGTLDETLRRLHRYYQEEGSRKLHAVAQWTPRAIYFFVALLIAWRVVGFWLGYFKQIGDVMKF